MSDFLCAVLENFDQTKVRIAVLIVCSRPSIKDRKEGRLNKEFIRGFE